MADDYYSATVDFEDQWVLSDLAKKLSDVTEVPMNRDDSGRFDEVPAFVGKFGALQISLLGTPDDRPSHHSELEITLETSRPVDEVTKCLPKFFSRVLVQKARNRRGYVDCSTELIQELQSAGFVNCSLGGLVD